MNTPERSNLLLFLKLCDLDTKASIYLKKAHTILSVINQKSISYSKQLTGFRVIGNFIIM